MQTEVPTLPVVHFNAHKNWNRKQNFNLRRSTVETKVSSPHKGVACFASNKKNLHPLPGRPYQSNVRQQLSSEQSKHNKTNIGQRVLSAKMLRIKELQNQLADAHYQLNELANENRLLKALQKKQDSALKRYEGTNAELPRIINSHHEELRILQVKYKKLKALNKETCDLLKDKEAELQHLQSQNKHLLQLSKDRNLGEREKLQLRVSDLNHRVQQQQETIQTLHRKLSLESKSLKHKLHVETSKRKETEKHLEEATEKLKNLETFLDNREKRSYYNGQLLLPNKTKHFGTRSLTNLRDISSSNPIKVLEKNKRWQEENSLPILHTPEANDKSKIDERINLSQTVDSEKTETMVNLEQIRKFRLQKTLPRSGLSGDSDEKSTELDFKMNEISKTSIHFKDSEKLDKEDEDENQYDISADTFKEMYKNRKYQHFNELLNEKGDYSTESSDNENESYMNVANNSRELNSRLISSTDNTLDLKELTPLGFKSKDKLKVLVHERKNSYESESEVESDIKKASMKHHLPMTHRNFKLISLVGDDQTDFDNEAEEITTSNFLNKSQKIHQNLISEMQMEMRGIENENHVLQCNVESTYATKTDDNHLITNAHKSSEDLKHMYEQSVIQDQEGIEKVIKKNEFDDSRFETLLNAPNEMEPLTSHKSANQLLFYPNEIPVNDTLNGSLNTLGFIGKGQTTNVIYDSKPEIDNTSEDNFDAEMKNELNTQAMKNESRNTDVLVNNAQFFETDSTTSVSATVSTTNEMSATARTINYNKEKLLATMKAIDNNENIEFINQDVQKHNATSRKQITENLYRGLPTHAKRRQDIIKDIFDTDGVRNKPAGSCSKLH